MNAEELRKEAYKFWLSQDTQQPHELAARFFEHMQKLYPSLWFDVDAAWNRGDFCRNCENILLQIRDKQ